MRRLALLILTFALLLGQAMPAQAQEAAGGRVVWVDGASADDGRALFPDDRVTIVERSINGVEWRLADAAVFGPARASAAEPITGELLAAGVAVIVQSDARPGGPWPWARSPVGWRAAIEPSGPRARLDERVYAAVDLRPVGRSWGQRRQVVLLAGLFSLAAIGASLLRRRAVAAVVGVSVLASVGLVAWGRGNETFARDRVTVIVVSDAVAQVDQWTIERSPQSMRLRVDPSAAGWPVLRDEQHASRADVAAKPGELSYKVDKAMPMALLRRDLRTADAMPAKLGPVDVPLRRLAALYASPSVSVLGLERASDDGTPVLWMRRDAAREQGDAR